MARRAAREAGPPAEREESFMTTAGVILMTVSLAGVWGLLFWCYREIMKD